MLERDRQEAESEYARLARGLRVQFLAELHGVTPQMVCRYRRDGAPVARVEELRRHLARQIISSSRAAA